MFLFLILTITRLYDKTSFCRDGMTVGGSVSSAVVKLGVVLI